jgi:hypothetical protein
MDGITIRQATAADVAIVDQMIREAAAWVDALGVVMWDDGELDADRIRAEVPADVLPRRSSTARSPARFDSNSRISCSGRIVRTGEAGVRASPGRAARRSRGAAWRGAARVGDGARPRARPGLLRLDCDANRPKLHALYESCGFRFHSYRHVGPYYVSRYEMRT